MWKIFFNYKDKSRCTVREKGTITPELAVKVRFNTRKDKTMTEVILFLPFLIIAIPGETEKTEITHTKKAISVSAPKISLEFDKLSRQS